MNFEGRCDMKIHLKFDESDPKDTRFTVVVNDTPCGQLSMMTEDAVRMVDIFKSGCSHHECAFEYSGDLYQSESWVIWRKRSGKERRSGRDRRTGQDRRSGEDRRK